MRLFAVALRLLCVVMLVLSSACSEPVSEQELLVRAQSALDEGRVNAALIDLKSVLQQNVDNVEARRLMGEAYLFQMDHRAAAGEFEKALQSSEDPLIMRLYAKALVYSGQAEKLIELDADGRFSAVQDSGDYRASLSLARTIPDDQLGGEPDIQKALELAPDDPYVLTSKAIFLLRGPGAIDDAETLLKQVVADHPDYASAWGLLGDIAQLNSRDEEALSHYQASAALNRFRLRDRLNLVAMLVQLDRIDEASQELASLQKLAPDHPGVNFEQGRVLLESGQYAAAAEKFSNVLLVLPSHHSTLYLLGSANLQEGNLEAAARQFKQFLVDHPNHLQASLQLAGTNLQLNLPAETERIARKILEEHTMNIPAMSLLAAALSMQGLHAQSAEVYAQISSEKPDSVEFQTNLGAELIRSGNLQQGVEKLRTARNLDPDAEGVWERLVMGLIAAEDLRGAKKEAQDYLAGDDKNPQAHVLLGRIAVREFDTELAREYFQQALALDAGNIPASHGLAGLELLNDDLEAAQGHYQRVLDIHEEDYGTLMSLASIEKRRGDTQAMLEALNKAKELEPKALEPRLALARYAMKEGHYLETIGLISEVQEEHDHESQVHQLLTGAYLAAGQLESAKKSSQRLLELVPNNVVVLTLAAQVDYAIGQIEDAETRVRAALGLEPTSSDLRKLLVGVLMEREKYGEAATEIEKLSPEQLLRADVKEVQGRIAMAQGNPKSAEAMFQQAFDLEPKSTTLLQLNAALWAQDKFEPATAMLNDWLQENPGDGLVRNQLAINYLQMDRKNDALPHYEKLVELAPNNVLILNNLAWLIRDQDSARALEYIQRADNLEPRNPKVKDTYAMIRLERGEYRQALALNRKALDAAPGMKTLIYHRAMILKAADRPEEAIAILQDLLKGPEFAETEEAKALLNELRGS